MPAIDLSQVKRVQDVISRLGVKTGPLVGDGLEIMGQVLLDESRKLVPVESGNLSRSGVVRRYGKSWNTIVVVGYGSMSMSGPYYSVHVHELMTKRHGTAYNIKWAKRIAAGLTRARRPQEQAKFLEYPLRNKLTELRQAFESRIK